MTTPFVGEIRMFSFQRTPVGWQACDGSLLTISDFSVLFQLIGTTYGGDGVSRFAVPDLRGRIPIHQGTAKSGRSWVLGTLAGNEGITLTVNQIPSHNHLFTVSSQPSTTASPGPTVILGAGAAGDELYFTPPTGGTQEVMSKNSGQPAGNGLPHDNNAPTLAVSFCIATAGIFPSQ
jgi:microcystin-dependent protein